MKKQMEGDNEQRRAAAADAREEGRSASEEGVSTGASKQRRALGNDVDHEERIRGSARGKQQPNQFAPDPKPGSTPSRRGMDEPPLGQTDGFPPRSGEHAVPGELDDRDQHVFRTLAELEGEASAPTTGDIARESGLDADDVLVALQRLINDHDIVQELPADPAQGRHFRVKSRA